MTLFNISLDSAVHFGECRKSNALKSSILYEKLKILSDIKNTALATDMLFIKYNENIPLET